VPSRVAGIETEAGFIIRDSVTSKHARSSDSRNMDPESFFSLAHDIERIHETLRLWKGCRLVVIDPISAFLDGIDVNSNMDVRRLLSRLGRVARMYDTAVLVISHFRKAAASMLLYRSLGSVAFTLATRVVLTLAQDPAVAGRRLLLPAKMNPVPEGLQQGRAFSIGVNELNWEPDPVELRPDDLRELTSRGVHVHDRLEETEKWLQKLLRGGRKPSTEVMQAAREAEIPTRLVYAARKRAQVRLVREAKDEDGVARWYWESRSADVLGWETMAYWCGVRGQRAGVRGEGSGDEFGDGLAGVDDS
jgi:putative DNA primase/helicase